MNSERYHELLADFIISGALSEDCVSDFWFQQDGAPPHTTHDNLSLLNQYWGSRVIARNYPKTFGCGLAWPPHSPDLSPVDFYLWGFVKDKVYKEPPKDLDQLQSAIKKVNREISVDTCAKVTDSFHARIQHCIATGWYHFENILH